MRRAALLLALLSALGAQCSDPPGAPAPRGASQGSKGPASASEPSAVRRPDPAAQKLDPGLAPAWRAIREGRHAEGRALVAGYLARAGDAARRGQAEFLLGVSYGQAELYEQAEPHYARALELEPEYLATRYYLGNALYHLGRLGEAREALEAYLAGDPGKHEAQFSLALVALEEDRVDEADALLAAAIATAEARVGGDGDQRDARADLARYLARRSDVHVRREDFARARADLERAVEIEPELYEAWHKLARARTRLGDEPGAEQAMARYEALFAERFPERAVPK